MIAPMASTCITTAAANATRGRAGVRLLVIWSKPTAATTSSPTSPGNRERPWGASGVPGLRFARNESTATTTRRAVAGNTK